MDKIGRSEDQLIREWIRKRYAVKLPQFFFWKLTPERAVDALKREDRIFANVTVEDILKAARRA